LGGGRDGGSTRLLILGKVRAVLDAFSVERPRLRLGEIRAATGLAATTCLRLLHNLFQEGFLTRDGDEYRIGTGMLHWFPVALAAIDVVGLARPVLDELRDQTDELACLFVAEGTTRVCVAMALSRQGTVRRLAIGESLPLHAGSAGKVLLAYDAGLLEKVKSGPLTRYTGHTLTDADELDAAVSAVRADGWAMSLNESYSGAGSLSAPIFSHDGSVTAAVCLAIPIERFDEDAARRWLPFVQRAAETLTSTLGGRKPVEQQPASRA
jgi:DNA-binding IclR family transcriptional regulator